MTLSAMSSDARAMAVQWMGLAFREANRACRRSGASLDELESEALHGLCRAAAWWNPVRKVPFPPLAAKIISQRLDSFIRKRNRSLLVPFTDVENGDLSLRLDAEGPRERDPIGTEDALQRLKKSIRPLEYAILWLHFAEGRSYKEIGEAIGMRQNVVKSRVYKLVRRLRRSGLRQELALEDT